MFLFFAGCRPEDATYVAVTAPIDPDPIDLFKISLKRSSVTFCKVRLERKMGTRYFYFRFRRFVYDDASNKFMAGSWDVSKGVNIGEWLDSSYLHQGLSKDEAVKRLGFVGPNVLKLKKPTVIGSIFTEFSKSFYLYQTFLVWTWGKTTHAPFDNRLIFTCSHKFTRRHLSTILVLLHVYCQ